MKLIKVRQFDEGYRSGDSERVQVMENHRDIWLNTAFIVSVKSKESQSLSHLKDGPPSGVSPEAIEAAHAFTEEQLDQLWEDDKAACERLEKARRDAQWKAVSDSEHLNVMAWEKAWERWEAFSRLVTEHKDVILQPHTIIEVQVGNVTIEFLTLEPVSDVVFRINEAMPSADA